MRRIGTGVRVSAVIIGCLWALASAAGQEKQAGEMPATEPVRYGPAHELAKLANPRVHESSGIACGRGNSRSGLKELSAFHLQNLCDTRNRNSVGTIR